MTVQTAVLTDVEAGIYVESLQWGSGGGPALAGAAPWGIRKHRLRGGVSDGVDVVELNNGALSVQVLPTRGMGLWRGSYRGIELGWKSPVAMPVHPAFVDQSARGGIGWLSGFNEWLCRCGLASFGPPCVDRVRDGKGNVVAEIPLTLHGRIANLPAHRVAVEVDAADGGTLRVVGEVDETMLFGPNLRLRSTVETRVGSNVLTIVDEVTNRGGQPGELCLLYHINVGEPFLETGSQLTGPHHEVAPRDQHAAADMERRDSYPAPAAGYREQCYFFRAAAGTGGDAAYLLRNSDGTRGMSVRFNPEKLPYFTVWKNTQHALDGCCTGLEPGTGYPNPKSFERDNGRVVKLEPGETWTSRLQLAIHGDRESVAAAETESTAFNHRTPPTVHRSPLPQWTAP